MLRSKRTVLTAIYFLSPLFSIIIFIYAITTYSPVQIPPLRYFTAVTGLAAYVWLTYSFILMARPKFLDEAFGMDSVLKFHKNMSIISLTLSFAHGLTLFLVFSAQTHDKLAFRSGTLAFAFLLILMLMSGLFLIESFLSKVKGFRGIRNRFGGKYNRHLTIHNFTLIATTILFAHLMLSTTTTYSVTLRMIYVFHYTIAFSFWFYHKVIRSISIKFHPYKITEIIKQNGDVWDLRFMSNNGRKILDYKPGQYCYLKITSLGRESHPFSFTSSPLQKEYFSIGIKNAGDYTSKIGNIKVGDKAYIDGPYGTFNHLDKNGKELVFIAGGIGITPFLSMLHYIKETDPSRKITLIWGVRSQNDMIFSSELEDLKKRVPNLSVVHILSEDDSWTKDCGFIDREMLEKYGSCEDPQEQNKNYFICGPKLMTNMVFSVLKDMKVSNSNIQSEQFNF
jgi:predicted ferric reductase